MSKRNSPVLNLFVLIILLSLSCRSSRPSEFGLLPGDHEFKLKHAGRERSYLLHAPPQVDEQTPLPVVFNLHGGGGNAASHKTYSRMDETADGYGFLAVYPNGTGPLPRSLLTWNAGRCCAYAMENNVDDVGFILAVLDDVSRRIPTDRARVYATGLSNGAMMSYRLAMEAADHMAAIAPVAGAVEMGDASPARPVPVMHIHSVDDPRALYGGGLGPPFPGTQRRVERAPVETALAGWIEFDGCSSQPAIGPTLENSEGHTATRYTYSPCQANSEVVLWKLSGAGHVWPGGMANYLEGILGPSTDVIDANEEIWQFFAAHPQP